MKIQFQKLKNSLLLFLPLLFMFAFLGCDKMDVKETYTLKIPIYKKLGEVRKMDIVMSSPQQVQNAGKIYLYKDHLFINEPNIGIHIYDNSNPASPKSLGMLPIIGNFDLGIQNDLLYADNIVDLLTFDISNLSKPVLVDRQKDVFAIKYKLGEIERYELLDTDLIPVSYRDSLINSEYKDKYTPKEPELIYLENYSALNNSGGGTNQVGQAGSTARFAISNNVLFAIYLNKVKNFDLNNPRSPKMLNEVDLGFGIETLFPYKKSLFVGASNGMHILDITNPYQPKHMATYAHVLACDPVVVNDSYAFVTLRTGTICGGAQNILEIVDIRNLNAPQQVKVYPMQNPHGLSLAGDYLYVSEGDFGLKSFKVNDVNAIDKNMVQHLDKIKSTDIIAGPKSLIVMGNETICQFDYSNKANLKQLSCITVGKSK
jgi:hypothetical protein